MKAICKYAFIPVRYEARESAEMETQILYGETFSVLETQGKWKKIRMDFDGYEGWIDAKLHTPVATDVFDRYIEKKRHIVSTPYTTIHPADCSHPLLITGGSETTEPTTNAENNIIDTARLFLGSPYLWGGRTFFGIDCSGFTQIVYKIHGIALPRNASQQIELGQLIEFIDDIKEGDLAFFDNDEGKITHVGLCVDNHTIIHASGCVRIDALDHYGIFNNDRNCYTHTLRAIKRVMPCSKE